MHFKESWFELYIKLVLNFICSTYNVNTPLLGKGMYCLIKEIHMGFIITELHYKIQSGFMRNAPWIHMTLILNMHDDVIKWKHFPRNWSFVWGIHRSPVNSPHKGQWRGALMFSLIWVWINGWVNNREVGDLRCDGTHYDVIVMFRLISYTGLRKIIWNICEWAPGSIVFFTHTFQGHTTCIYEEL